MSLYYCFQEKVVNICRISYVCHREIVTTGADGDIRIWKDVDDDDPNTRCVGEFILYHVYYDNRILASTDLNTVQAYTYPGGDRDGVEFRFTASVTCIKVNKQVTHSYCISIVYEKPILNLPFIHSTLPPARRT